MGVESISRGGVRVSIEEGIWNAFVSDQKTTWPRENQEVLWHWSPGANGSSGHSFGLWGDIKYGIPYFYSEEGDLTPDPDVTIWWAEFPEGP